MKAGAYPMEMNQAHLHTILVHFPVVLLPVALIVLLVGDRLRSRAVLAVAFSLLALSASFAVPAFLLGEGAEEIVEHLQGVSEEHIEQHEEVAEVSLWLVLSTGILSIGGLIGLAKSFSRQSLLNFVVIILSLVTSVMLSYTAYLGGQIRHTEFAENS